MTSRLSRPVNQVTHAVIADTQHTPWRHQLLLLLLLLALILLPLLLLHDPLQPCYSLHLPCLLLGLQQLQLQLAASGYKQSGVHIVQGTTDTAAA